ncbi:uncharacterized protein LACBIDRAFT_305817 [Laccaria bicolor S238N-H82]|uniref:Predicted protein n=1 Tax=Laccaria bicolor (strain S238N-H82 / ATCC MYA-4686) TaxID=486041 RepID=B0CS02_LACBS|nr:uncharacterized protein LACBIDRAFT_305817 [Laccaria bicolor S238N-H82]EDR14770.1 predicted protein [Laccaria bicolor S238N-H82]|eukprot:XP_001875329.1 predicted protein [Laccaria bicolor S238N-H82]
MTAGPIVYCNSVGVRSPNLSDNGSGTSGPMYTDTAGGLVNSSELIQFSGHQHFRLHLVLSILSGKAVQIDKIRSDDKDPSLQGFKRQKLCAPEPTLLQTLESALCLLVFGSPVS